MVEQVSGDARPRQDAGRCHRGEPLIVTENYLLLHAEVLPSACTCCQGLPCLLSLLASAPIALCHQWVRVEPELSVHGSSGGGSGCAGRQRTGDNGGEGPGRRPQFLSRCMNSCTGSLFLHIRKLLSEQILKVFITQKNCTCIC